jgi:hypothetical protein
MSRKNKFDNLVGRKFGNRLITKFVEFRKDSRGKNQAFFESKCLDCGKIKICKGSSIKRTKGCICIHPIRSKEYFSKARIKYVGKKFGKLTVIKYISNEHWELKCDCGNQHVARIYPVIKGHTKSCGCNSHSRGKNASNYKGYNNISGHFWSKIKCGAKRRQLEFNISKEYAWNILLQQNFRCTLSGIKLKLTDSAAELKADKESITASIDRIDSSKGYVEGNIQWIHKKLNIMKLDMSQSEFINQCKAVASNHQNFQLDSQYLVW